MGIGSWGSSQERISPHKLKAPETGVPGAFWVPLQLIGSSIVPSSLVIGIRVSSSPRVFRSRRPRSFGLPLGCILRLVRQRTPRVAPRRTPFSCAGDGSASCLASHPSRCLRRFPGLPRVLAPPASLPVFPPGCPGFPTFRLCQRWSFGLPRVSMPSALPAVIPRVAPLPRSSSFASGASAGLPRLPHLWLCRR